VTAVVEAVDVAGSPWGWEFALIESNVVTECLGVLGRVVEVDTAAVLEVVTSVTEASVLLTVVTVTLVVGSCDDVIEGTVVFLTVADATVEIAVAPTGVEGTEVAAETVVKESVLLLLVRIVVEAVEEKVDFSKSS